MPLRDGPAVEPSTWNLLDPVDSSPPHPKKVITSPYLHPPEVTSELDTCSTSCLSKVQLPELCLQGWSPLCPGGLFGQEVSKARASGKKDRHDKVLGKAGFSYKFLGNSKIIKKQTNQGEIYNEATSILLRKALVVWPQLVL